MPDPQEPLKLLAVPSHASDVDAWDAPMNANYTAIGGMLGGFATVSLTNVPVTLTSPSGTPTAGAGPTQSQNSLIIFTGTLGANVTVTIPLPGQYNILNNTVVGSFYVQLSCGSGNKIGCPPGEAVSVFANGTDMQYISLPPVGSYWDYAGSTVPAWITACTVAPWKQCDGTVLNISDWPQLYAIIGANFGGNGLTTFALPDYRNRAFYPLDTGTPTNRITSAISGISGTTLGAAGGNQSMQTHNHGITEPNGGQGHQHNIKLGGTTGGGQVAVTGVNAQTANMNTDFATTGITINNSGSGSSQNMPPALIGGIKFIRMG